MSAPEPIIEARGLGKTFRRRREPGTVKRLFTALRKRDEQVVHALRDVTFRIMPGESVALVGHNGSGKSTLLSLIGRIYLPTAGTLRVGEGWRVAPLLELGAGFHRELSGRENVRLNGVILGLTGAQVEERMAAIVAFAELEEKIDTTFRNYSSGEQMRLGFAVASHTDAPVLLVDEVLGPADEAFQQKCFARIRQFQREGRTILFVSHDADAVREVAERALWLDHGRLRADGALEPILAEYQAEARAQADAPAVGAR